MSTASDLPRPLCPKCFSDFVKRSRRTGLVEHLMSSFSIYPFRCQLCRHRFRLRQKGITYRRTDEDRREYERLAVNLAATFSLGTVRGLGQVMDLSMAGCALGTETRLGIGDILRLELQLPDRPDPIQIDTAILRSVHSNHARLEFLQFRSGHREALQAFVRELISSRAARKG
ncbi:MAG TPA: PilZ domain-containing protein [Geothrix sp.]|nr:PilZ domain-containing protein [Geothrix sp.]